MGQPVRTALRKGRSESAGLLPGRRDAPGDVLPGRRLLENTGQPIIPEAGIFQRLPKDANCSKTRLTDGKVPARPRETTEDAKSAGSRIEPVFDWSRSEHREPICRGFKKGAREFPFKDPTANRRRKGFKPHPAFRLITRTSDLKRSGRSLRQTIKEAEAAVAAAKSAFSCVAGHSRRKNGRTIFSRPRLLPAQALRTRGLQVSRSGSTWSESDADVCEAIDYLEYYGREMLRLRRTVRDDGTATR